MAPSRSADVDAYIAACAPPVRVILQKMRETIHRIAPKAVEVMSYKMPAFELEGRVLVYFAAFKKHIGLYPPVRGHAALARAVAPYSGPKGNLQFPIDQAIPYGLVARIIRSRASALTGSRQKRS
jgi:uncharacterized protein YdhG (YjbR/CyaY superfamily)